MSFCGLWGVKVSGASHAAGGPKRRNFRENPEIPPLYLGVPKTKRPHTKAENSLNPGKRPPQGGPLVWLAPETKRPQNDTLWEPRNKGENPRTQLCMGGIL